MNALLLAGSLLIHLQVVERADLWLSMIHRLHGPDATPSSQPMTEAQQAWAALIRSRSQRWESEIPALSAHFAPVPGPEIATIAIGNGGGEDAFTHDATTIGFDVARLHAEYGDAASPENTARIDRFFRHEYTHLLQKAWLAQHPYTADTPLRAALLGIWKEGFGNYYSLSPRWRGDLAVKTLSELEPRFVARLAALACASPSTADALTADLSMGRFDQKWGALPVALWLDADASRSPDALRQFVLAGPDGVWNLAERHLSEDLRAVLREARVAADLCVLN
jgi:hypothetical protein